MPCGAPISTGLEQEAQAAQQLQHSWWQLPLPLPLPLLLVLLAAALPLPLLPLLLLSQSLLLSVRRLRQRLPAHWARVALRSEGPTPAVSPDPLPSQALVH